MRVSVGKYNTNTKGHPGHRRGEGETRNNGVEGLGLELLGNEVDSFDSSGHGVI